ncbi:MAG: response regulator [Sphingobacteriia bacterium]|nr:response regulator [Sphingobacteriia bacterium]
MVRARAFLVFVMLICTSSLFAQDDLLDFEHKSPSERFNKLKVLVDSLLEVEDTLALSYSVRMFEIGEQLNDNTKKADAYRRMGTSNMLQSNYPKAKELNDKANDLYSKEKNEEGVADCNLLYGLIYRNLQIFDRSVEKTMEALAYYNKEQIRKKQLIAYITIGNVLVLSDIDEKGRENLFHALDMTDPKKDIQMRGRILLGIARSYIADKDFPNVHKTISKIESEYTKSNDKFLKLLALIAKSEVAYAEKNYSSSLSLSLQGVKLAHEIKNEGQETHLLTRIAHLYSISDNWDSVLYYNKLAQELRLKSGRFSNISSSYINIGTSYLQKKDFPNAEDNLLKGLDFAYKIGHQVLIQKAYRHLIQLYIQWKDNKKALEFYEKNYDYVEKLTKSSTKFITKTTFDELEKRYISSSEADGKNWYIILLASGLAVVILVSVSSFLYMKRKSIHLQTENLSLSNRLNEALEKINTIAENQLSNISLLNLFDAGAIIVDERFTITNVSSGLYKFLEYTKEDLFQKPFSFLLSSEDRIKIYQNVKSITSGNKLITEIQLRSLSGNTIHTRATFHPINHQNRIQVAIFLIDIAKEIEIKKKLNESLIKAEESERQKSVFLSNVSNDIKSPVKSILTVLQNWQISAPDNLRGRWLSDVTNSTNDLINYIDNIIEFSNLQSEEIRLNLSPVNLKTLVGDIINSFNKSLSEVKSSITLTSKTFLNTDYLVSIDASLLTKAIKHIIQNSIRYSQDGKIEIEWRKTEDKKLLLTFMSDGLKISPQQLAVVQGIERPIDETYSQRLSDTGLNLAIAKSFINKLGGKIWGDNLIDSGTVIYIALDAEWIDPTIWDGSKLPELPIPNLSKHSILVAEDVEENFSFIKALLNKTGARITWVKNGKEALNEAKSKETFDLIIMDVQMPVMDGYTTSRLIRSEFPYLPIIVQTAFASPDEDDIALAAGCDAVIHKPIQLAEFWETIINHINIKKKLDS